MHTMSKSKPTKRSSYHLAALLRREADPTAALSLFLAPTLSSSPSSPPPPPPNFRYSLRCYDVIIRKLAAARMFPAMEHVISLLRLESPRVSLPDPLLCHVISSYGRAHLPAAALRSFLSSPNPTTRTLNSLLHALLNSRTNLKALVSLCRNLEAAAAGVAPDACTYNILIRAAGASGSVSDAYRLFDEMLERNVRPTVVTFGTLIAALCESEQLDKAFRLKEVMVGGYGLKPNVFIYASLIKGLCKCGELVSAIRLKEDMALDEELVLDSAVYATLIRALFRVGRKGEVVGMLEEMKGRGIRPDTVAYNAMISGFCEDEKDFDAAFEVLDEMGREGCRPDVVSFNTVVGGLCKVGQWRDAGELVEDMPRQGCRPDVVTYRILFEAICCAKEFGEAQLVLDEMVFKGFAPSKESVRKFVDGIGTGGGGVSLESALCRLAKVNALEPSRWEQAIGGILKDSEKENIAELMDSLKLD